MKKKKKNYSLVGVDGNAFAVMGYVRNAMRESGMSKQQIDEYMSDATSGDYNHLLNVSAHMIETLNK